MSTADCFDNLVRSKGSNDGSQNTFTSWQGDSVLRFNEQEISIITVIHDLNLAARYCDRIAVLKDGELLAINKPREVLTHELLKNAFQVETCQIETPIGFQICTIKSDSLDK